MTDHLQTIRQLASQGVDASDIAKRTGLPLVSLCKVASRNDIELPGFAPKPLHPRKGRTNKDTPEMVADIRYWASRGLTATLIGVKVGLWHKTVRLIADKHAIEIQSHTNKEAWLSVRQGVARRQRFAPQVRKLAAEGYASFCIAQIMEISPFLVRKIAKEHDIELPRRTRPELMLSPILSDNSRKASGETRSAYVLWQGEKVRLVDKAAELGIHTTTLVRRIRAWGLERAMTQPKVAPQMKTAAANSTVRRREREQDLH